MFELHTYRTRQHSVADGGPVHPKGIYSLTSPKRTKQLATVANGGQTLLLMIVIYIYIYIYVSIT